MIKAVLFDYGGVMADGGCGFEITDRIAVNLRVTKEKAFQLLDVGWTLYANGTISEAEFWNQLEIAYGRPIPEDKRNIWNSWDAMKPKPEMVAFVNELKNQKLRIGLLSNVIPYTMNQIRDHGVYDMFDFTILSAEVGVGKPDAQIYQLALDKLPGVRPDEVIFIDDQPRFLEPAQQLGIHTVLATTPEQIISTINQIIQDEA